MILKDEKGMVLIIVMFILLIVMVLGTSLLLFSQTETNFTARQEKKIQAYYIARSGADIVAKSIENQIISPSQLINKTSEPTALGEGYFTVSVSGDSTNLFLDSNGYINDITETVTLQLSRNSLLANQNMAVYVRGNLNLDGGTINGNIGTNMSDPNSIYLGWVNLNGNLYIGPEGTPEEVISLSGNREPFEAVNGEILNLASTRSFQLPPFPDFPDHMTKTTGTYHIGWEPEPPYYLTEDIWYDQVWVESELIINIYDENRVIRTGDLLLNGDGKITVNRHGDGRLIIYVSNSFSLEGYASINKNGNPEDVFIYYSGADPLMPDGTTKYVGSIYNLQADITMTGSGGLMGHIITGGNKVTISGDASTTVRALFAPDSIVNLDGSGHFSGTIIANELSMTGEAIIDYKADYKNNLPGIIAQQDNYYYRIWK